MSYSISVLVQGIEVMFVSGLYNVYAEGDTTGCVFRQNVFSGLEISMNWVVSFNTNNLPGTERNCCFFGTFFIYIYLSWI
jgi:hypothetical protein